MLEIDRSRLDASRPHPWRVVTGRARPASGSTWKTRTAVADLTLGRTLLALDLLEQTAREASTRLATRREAGEPTTRTRRQRTGPALNGPMATVEEAITCVRDVRELIDHELAFLDWFRFFSRSRRRRDGVDASLLADELTSRWVAPTEEWDPRTGERAAPPHVEVSATLTTHPDPVLQWSYRSLERDGGQIGTDGAPYTPGSNAPRFRLAGIYRQLLYFATEAEDLRTLTRALLERLPPRKKLSLLEEGLRPDVGVGLARDLRPFVTPGALAPMLSHGSEVIRRRTLALLGEVEG